MAGNILLTIECRPSLFEERRRPFPDQIASVQARSGHIALVRTLLQSEVTIPTCQNFQLAFSVEEMLIYR